MVKYAILGDGLLGAELHRQTKWDILSRSKDGIDITHEESWAELLFPYDVIINCIAYTNTYDEVKDLHWRVNYQAVAALVDYCNKYEKKLVHISTDYVYANSKNYCTEEGIPIHSDNWYSYTKLLADAYIELRSHRYLILRGTHKPTPFPYEKAWVDQVGMFDYVDKITTLYINLIENNAEGLYNVGTALKNMHELAQQTKANIPAVCVDNLRIPKNVTMSIEKLTNFITNKAI
jgi:nucleoside-diphosphate-sugar epimerase